MDAAIRAAHPLAPILNAAFDRALAYGELAAMLAPRPARPVTLAPAAHDRLWTDLTHLYELGIAQSLSAENGRKLMFDLAVLHLDTLGDRRSAETHLRRCLATDPAHGGALDNYLQLLIEERRFEEAAELLDRAIAQAGEDERPDLLIELASVAYLHLAQPDRAVAALRLAFDLDRNRIDVLARARVILIEQERWEDVKCCLDEETAHVLAWGGDDDDAAMHALAEAYRLLADRAYKSGVRYRLAEECYRRAGLLGDAESVNKHDVMQQVAANWTLVAARCRKKGIDSRDRKRAAKHHLRAAGLHLEYGLDYEGAEVAFDRSWLLDRGSRHALDLLERIHLDQHRPETLLAKLRSMAEVEKDRPAKLEILLRAARIAARAGEDPIAWYSRVLELAPTNEEAIDSIDRLLTEQGLHLQRAELLQSRLARASRHREKRIRIELARIYAEVVGDYARATKQLERVLALDPYHFEAASMLRAIYRDLGDEESLARVLEVLVEYCPDRNSRRALLAGEGVRERRFRKWRHRRSPRTRAHSEASCMPSPRSDNLAADGRKGRAAEEEQRPVS